MNSVRQFGGDADGKKRESIGEVGTVLRLDQVNGADLQGCFQGGAEGGPAYAGSPACNGVCPQQGRTQQDCH